MSTPAFIEAALCGRSRPGRPASPPEGRTARLGHVGAPVGVIQDVDAGAPDDPMHFLVRRWTSWGSACLAISAAGKLTAILDDVTCEDCQRDAGKW